LQHASALPFAAFSATDLIPSLDDDINAFASIATYFSSFPPNFFSYAPRSAADTNYPNFA
jgi:hypothetical protein